MSSVYRTKQFSGPVALESGHSPPCSHRALETPPHLHEGTSPHPFVHSLPEDEMPWSQPVLADDQGGGGHGDTQG